MQRTQSGYFLVEALIALVIFSIGALGIVNLYGSLQVRGQDAQLRVLANAFANEVLNVMIADNINSTCYTIPQGSCSSSVATTYMTTWSTNVSTTLPGSSTTPPVISIDSSNRVTITIQLQRHQDPFAHNLTLLGQI